MPHTNDTLIHIDIQADDKLEILNCVRDTLEYMPKWTFYGASQNISIYECRFYTFNLTRRTFLWWRYNHSLSDTQDADEVVIKDMADISNVLEFVYLNAEELRQPNKKGIDLSALYEKMVLAGKTSLMKIAPSYPKWEGMDTHKKMHISAESIFCENAGDLSPYHYEVYIKSVKSSQSQLELTHIHKKILGFHGPNADQLKTYILMKIAAIKEEKAKLALVDWKDVPVGTTTKFITNNTPNAFFKFIPIIEKKSKV